MAGATARADEPVAADLQLLETAARSNVPDVDLSTRRVRVWENGRGASAWFETTRRIDPDGAEWWKLVLCGRDTTSPSWSCSADPQKSVRVTPPAGGTPLEVAIPLGLSGLAAHRFILPGLQLIPQTEVRLACNPHESDAVQQLEIVKRDFAAVSGNKLSLSTERGGFALQVGARQVHFEFDLLRDPAPRVRCWDDGDELE